MYNPTPRDRTLNGETLLVRPAAPEDLHGVVHVLLTSRKTFIAYAPIRQSEAAVQHWIAGLIATGGCVSVACLGDVLIGVSIVCSGNEVNWIDQLYIAPGHTGAGIGRDLLAHAIRILGRVRPIRLYTFQMNAGARRFYERAGFKAISLTDGSGNEEQCPDVLYELEKTT